MSWVSKVVSFARGGVAVGKPAEPDKPAAQLDTIVSIENTGFGGVAGGIQRFNLDDLVGRKGLSIYSKMRIDEQVKAVVIFVRDSILSRGWCFEFDRDSPLSETEKKTRVRVFEQIVCKMPGAFIDSLNVISTGREFGFSLTEKVYTQLDIDKKTYIGLKSLLGRDPGGFNFRTDKYGELIQCEQWAAGERIGIDLEKFIHYVHNPEFDRYFGRSDLREAHRAWYMKTEFIKLWAMGLEKFAGGMLVGKLTPDSSIVSGSAQESALRESLSRARTASALVVPVGVDVSVEFPAQMTGFKEAIEYHDQAIAKSLLVPQQVSGHASQNQSGGNFSQASTQLESFAWRLKADADRLEACLNDQLFEDLGELNWGDGQYPMFRFKPLSTEQLRWLIATWTQLITGKAVIPTEADEKRLREVLEMPPRDEKSVPLQQTMNELTLQPPPPVAPAAQNVTVNQKDGKPSEADKKEMRRSIISELRAEFSGDLPGHDFRGNQYTGGGAPDPELISNAAKIAAMPASVRDNTEIGDMPGHAEAYALYEAQKMMPKPSDKLRPVNSNNSMILGDEWHYIANVDGRLYGITKYEDPDASDDNEDENGKMRQWVYAYKPLDTGIRGKVLEPLTANKDDLFRHIRGEAQMSRTSFEYDESQHPRDDNGRWADGSGNDGTKQATSIIKKALSDGSSRLHLKPKTTRGNSTSGKPAHEQSADNENTWKNVQRAVSERMKEKGYESTTKSVFGGTETTYTRANGSSWSMRAISRSVEYNPNATSLSNSSREYIIDLSYKKGSAKMSITARDARLVSASARERVDFAVIDRKQATMAQQLSADLSDLVAKAVQRLLGDDENLTHLTDNDPSDIASAEFSGVDVGRIKSRIQRGLADAWAFGREQAQQEIRRTGRKVLNVRDAVYFADLRDKSSKFFEANSFRMAGNVSDGARSVIQTELQNAVKSGRTPAMTREAIWTRLASKGFSSREAIKTIVNGGPDDAGIERALDALNLESEMAAAKYLDTLTRTNLFESMNESRYAEFNDPQLGDFVVAFRYSAIMDERTTDICSELHDHTWSKDSEVWDEYRPPNHFNCRSILVPVTQLDVQDGQWDGEDDADPTVTPQDGFA
jgi:SPP1 gp7 family putative phage head morphogenesis protein